MGCSRAKGLDHDAWSFCLNFYYNLRTLNSAIGVVKNVGQGWNLVEQLGLQVDAIGEQQLYQMQSGSSS